MSIEIGFLGYGKMAGAISDGLSQKLIPYAKQIASNRSPNALEKAAAKGVIAAADNIETARRARVLVLGVHPDQILGVLREISGVLTEDHLIISLAAGLPLSRMRGALPSYAGLARALPNVAVLVGQGATIICGEAGANPAWLAKTRDICESVGLCLELDESLFDAGTALSGCGLAYYFMIMEAFTRGAVRLGLPQATARTLAAQTILGAAETARAAGAAASLSALRDMVTSPAGATAEALHLLEVRGLNGILQEALEAAAKRSREMSSL